MAQTPRWVALTAVSALGLGALAGGAVGVANAMPLVDSVTASDVPPITTVANGGAPTAQLDVKANGRFTVPGSAGASTTATQPASVTPAPPPAVQPAPAPPAQPVAPNPASSVSPPSVDSVD